MPSATGVARRGYTMRDEQRAAEVSLSGVQVGADAVLGEVGKGLALIERVIEAGIAATAAESVGAMEALHAMTLEYSRTREQFGKPIGSNQVVQHRLAEMLMSLEQGRSMAMLAAMMVDEADAARAGAQHRHGEGRHRPGRDASCRRTRCSCMAASA